MLLYIKDLTMIVKVIIDSDSNKAYSYCSKGKIIISSKYTYLKFLLIISKREVTLYNYQYTNFRKKPQRCL